MRIKNQILLNIKAIQNPMVLQEIFEFLQQFKSTAKANETTSNKEAVMQFAGVLGDEDAAEIRGIVDVEFNTIEGD